MRMPLLPFSSRGFDASCINGALARTINRSRRLGSDNINVKEQGCRTHCQWFGFGLSDGDARERCYLWPRFAPQTFQNQTLVFQDINLLEGVIMGISLGASGLEFGNAGALRDPRLHEGVRLPFILSIFSPSTDTDVQNRAASHNLWPSLEAAFKGLGRRPIS